MIDSGILDWLLTGDVAIQYQTKRDLLGIDDSALQQKIQEEGWGKRFLALQNSDGHWGQGFYKPKWISTHYTLLDLKNLQIARSQAAIFTILEKIIEEEKGPDGGLLPIGTTQRSDVCVNGMALNYLSYFGISGRDLTSIIDFILSQQMPDGGFNCQLNRKGAVHSSLHSTISVLEGFLEYRKNGYTYRLEDLRLAEQQCIKFILLHRLYKSDKTGEIIHPQMLRLSYPSRWKYDVLRALDYFQAAEVPYEERMKDALTFLQGKRKKEGKWNLQQKHPGQNHFEMEKAGKASRWNTLRALRVLKFYQSHL